VQLSRDEVLALLTAYPDTLELGDVPDWLAQRCAALGLLSRTAAGAWKLTEAGYAEYRARIGHAAGR
jgi:hypothetical protein